LLNLVNSKIIRLVKGLDLRSPECLGKTLLALLLLSVFLNVDFPIGPVNLNPQDLLFLPVAAFFLVRIVFFSERKPRPFSFALIVPVGLLILYGILQAPFVKSQIRVIAEIVQLLEVFLLIFILGRASSLELGQDDIELILFLFYIFSIAGAINDLVYVALTGRHFLGNIWFLFGSLIYGLFYALYRAMFTGEKIHYFSLPLFAAAIIFSESRGLWLVVIISIGFISLLSRKVRVRVVPVVSVLLVAAIIAGLFGALPRSVTASFNSLFTGSQGRDVRFYRWAVHGLMFLDHPMGVGLGNGRFHTPDYVVFDADKLDASPGITKFDSDGPMPAVSPHSDWFALLGETGFIGVILYGVFWGVIFKDILLTKEWSTETLVIATFLASLFAQSFIKLQLMTGGGVAIVFAYYFYRKFAVTTTFKKKYLGKE